MDGVQVATTTVKQLKLKEALKNNYVKTAILIVIVLGSGVSLIFGIKAVLRTEYPLMVVATPSMVPTLPVGTLIVVQGYADRSTIYAVPKPNGDIVVFWHWDPARGLENWVHRAIGEITVDGKRYLITQGDANPGPDTHYNITTHTPILQHLYQHPLPEEYVIGKVVANVPYLGQVALSLQTPEGRIIIIVLVVALLIVEFVPFSKRKDKEQVLEQEQVKA
jgi:signal peptidase I